MSIDLRTKHGWEDLKRILDDRPEDVLALCRIKARPGKGSVVVFDDPRGNGRGNFAVWLKRDGLSWKNYTNDERGRSLELIAYCEGWYHLENRGAKEAANHAMDKLGIGRISDAQLQADRSKAKAAQVKQQADADEELRRKQLAAFNLFRNAVPILGTPAETYWREARGIDLRAAPFIGPRNGSLVPHSLRFVPRHKYVRRDKDGNKIGESFHPCMIACCTDTDGEIRAVHQTWLRADGRDKAQPQPAPDGTEQKPRKVFPDSRGLVIPLWRGEGHMSVKDAMANGVVETGVLTEGNEDGLTAVVTSPQYRTWAMISLSNFANVVARLPANWEAVIVHRQNEWTNGPAVKQFERGMQALHDSGRMAAELLAAVGKDLNDTHRGAA